MKEILFGKNQILIDHFKEYSSLQYPKAHQRDHLAFQDLQKKISQLKSSQGNLFIIFLDSTHSEYSFPESFENKFQPIAPYIDYLKFSRTQQDLPLIKNRYYNALHYLDSLFGNFISTLKDKKLFEDSFIVITADHGEEFYEEGSLFHTTHLNRYQTHIPLYFKLPSSVAPQSLNPSSMISQIDIFPTILHTLFDKKDFKKVFQGQSIFDEAKWPFLVSINQNIGNLKRFEFVINNGTYKLHGKMQPFKPKGFEVLFIKDQNDNILFQNEIEKQQKVIYKNFTEALKKIF